MINQCKRILIVGLGGTIGSVKKDSITLDNNCLKILEYCKFDNVIFDSVSPFTVFSENITKKHWQILIDYLNTVDFGKYIGIIILHGSDTLAFTSSIIANAFPTKNIVIVASDKPIEDKYSNAIPNFNGAVKKILEGKNEIYVSYDGIKKANAISSANTNDVFVELGSTIEPINNQIINDKNILLIKSYAGIDYENYNLKNVDEVLIEMYHSATVPIGTKEFLKVLKKKNIPYHFVTHKASADYETAKDIDNIIFDCTLENAYAIELLK